MGAGHRMPDRPASARQRPHPSGPAEWRAVLADVVRDVQRDEVLLVAAGMAFYAMLAVFPALIAVVSLYGLVSNPADVQVEVEEVLGALPPSAREVISGQLSEIVAAPRGGLGFGLGASLVASLWSVSTGVKALTRAINHAYDVEEPRGFLRARLLSLAVTVGIVVFVVLAVAAIVVLPVAFAIVGLEGLGSMIVRLGRWPALGLTVVGGLMLLYRFAPNRPLPPWRSVVPGAVAAAVLWLGASLGFSVYASNFGTFGAAYGTLGAIIVLLLWFFLSGLAVLVGAELNGVLERRGPERAESSGTPVPVHAAPDASGRRDQTASGAGSPSN